MPVPANTYVDRNSGSIQEVLGQAAMLTLRAKDPVFRDLVTSNAGVEPLSGLGRDKRYRRRYHPLSAVGVVENGGLKNFVSQAGDDTSPLGHDVASNADGPASKHFLQNLTQVAPDPVGSARQKVVGLTFGLHEAYFSTMELLADMDLDALPSSVMQHTHPHVMGFALNIVHYMLNQFYSSGNSMKLGTFPTSGMSSGNGSAGANIDTANFLIRFAPTEGNTYRFFEGMEVDIWPAIHPGTPTHRVNGPSAGVGAADSTDINPAKRVRVIVHSVDHMEGLVTLAIGGTNVTVDGTAAVFATWATAAKLQTAYVTPANAYQGATYGFSSFFGWRHFLKWGNYASVAADRRILGADAITSTPNDYIDVQTMPYFKSYHRSNVGALTMELLASYIEGFNVGGSVYGHRIDTLMGCRGLWTNMTEQDIARYTIEIGGRPGGLAGRGQNSNTGEPLVFDGQLYYRRTSDFLEDGLCLGLNGSGNFQFATDAAGAGGETSLDADETIGFPVINPIAQLTKGALETMPILANSGINSTRQMPTTGSLRWYIVKGQLMAKQMPGMVLEGCSTTKRVSSAV